MLLPDLTTDTSFVLETATSTRASDFQLRFAKSPTFILSSAIKQSFISTTSLLRAPKKPIWPDGDTAKSIRVRQCRPATGSTAATVKLNPSCSKSILPILKNCSLIMAALNSRC
ncbi:unannotated protein [freshwater metagenome]|uniref:Unannotated protein n=1 Tax=freshwater metagenome TaxID=449393 RepID=A0A6J5Z912_9ZZZZ